MSLKGHNMLKVLGGIFLTLLVVGAVLIEQKQNNNDLTASVVRHID
jgi:hypothetical protein